MNILRSLLILSLIFSSCDPQKKEKEAVSEEVQPPFQADSIPVTTPVPDSAEKIDASAVVLTTGLFHEEEVWEGAEKEEWYGIFYDAEDYVLRKTAVSVKRAYDALGDQEGEMTGWEVTAEAGESPIILIGGLDYLKDRDLKSALPDFTTVYPGDTLRFNYLGQDYEIVATGQKAGVRPGVFGVSDYRLFLSLRSRDEMLSQLLVSHQEFEDAMTTIRWAGDLDGDGFLDLVIDLSNHYNMSEPAVFLSKPAQGDNLVQHVGSHASVGC